MKNEFSDLFLKEIKNFQPHLPEYFFETCLKFDKVFHLHIPKTGGTFLNKALKDYTFGKKIKAMHGSCNSVKIFPDPTDSIAGSYALNYLEEEDFNSSLKIAIVRNPYDWLVSFYYHQQDIDRKDMKDPTTLESMRLLDVHGVGSLRKLYSSFEEFVFAYCDPDAYWPEGLKGFKNFIPFQIFDDTGESQVDFCLRNENLSFAIYALLLGLGTDLRVAQQVVKKDKANISKNRLYADYRKYYTDNMVLALGEKFEKLNSALGYNFNDCLVDKNLIIDLKDLNYFPISNKITYKGK